MALNSKQIYNRLNRVYENEFDGTNDLFHLTDEWYGSDDETVWHWYRPSEQKYYMMELDLDTKAITCSSRTKGEDWHEDFVLKDKQY